MVLEPAPQACHGCQGPSVGVEAALVTEHHFETATALEIKPAFLFARKTSSTPDFKNKLVLLQLPSHLLH